MGECKVKGLENDEFCPPYEIHTKFIKSSNRLGYYFLRCHYCNLWLINVHPPTNPTKPRSNFTLEDVDAIS